MGPSGLLARWTPSLGALGSMHSARWARSPRRLVALLFLWAVFISGCGGRDPFWDLPTDRARAFALVDAVAVADPAAERVLLVTTDPDRNAYRTEVPIQRGARAVMVAPDRSKLFVVSDGDGDRRPPKGKQAQGPALEIVSRGAGEAIRYPLSEPLGGLALDPRGQWAVLFADQSSSSLVRNPNELLLVDLTQPASTDNPRAHTLRSFGGRPQRFTFTEALELPGGRRRLLIVETEQDVAVLDLSRPSDPEITIQLTSAQSATRPRPAGIAVSDGDAGPDDARVAIRLDGGSTLVLAQFAAGVGRDFSVTLNLVDAGGPATDARFVRTDGGTLALAALVPSRQKAVLIDPRTNLTQDVLLPAPYSELSLVTGQVDGTGTGTTPATSVDVALLWNGGQGGVAFWELGRTAGRPYRSVETIGVVGNVTSVVDVAGVHPELKILATQDTSFFLLDLQSRTSSPFLTSAPGVAVRPSAAGDRAWVFVPNTDELAVVDVATLHPERMRLDRNAQDVFEIAAVENGGAAAGARSLIGFHPQGTMGLTIFDARATSDFDVRKNVSGLLIGGSDAR